MADFSHISVLLSEAVNGLDIKENGVYIDGTAGGGGHSAEILSHLKDGRLICIDRDPDAIETLTERFKNDGRVTILQGNYSDMAALTARIGVFQVNGVLLDIGVSSHQLDIAERGFSYHEDAPLDMRMSQSGVTAAELVNTLPEDELSRILFTYGEEKYARSIVRGIAAYRAEKPIETTLELAEIIKNNVPQRERKASHPARKTFQALRIATNGELDALEKGTDAAFDILCVGGRLCVITFHSLEDRIVKRKMAELARGCTCPKDFPVCVCGNKPKARIVTHKPIIPSEEELENNPRSRSAKLRICEKL